MITNHILLQNNCAVLAIPLDVQEDFTDELIRFYETNDNRSFKNFLYETSIEMLPSGLTQPVLKELIISKIKKDSGSENQEEFEYLEEYPIEKLNNILKLQKYGDEKVFVLPVSKIEGVPDKFNYAKHDDKIWKKYDNQGIYINRWEAEGDSSFQQIIPYFFVTNEDASKVFIAKRIDCVIMLDG